MAHAYLSQLRLTTERRVRVKLIIFRNLIINQHNHIAMRSFSKGLAHILQKPVNVLLHPVLGEMPLAPSTSVNPRGGGVKNIPDAYKPETTLSTVTCGAFPLLELHQEHLDDLHLHPSSGTIAKSCARPANEMPQPPKSALPSPQPHPRIWDPMSSPPTKITNDRKSKPPSPLLRIMHPCDRQRLKSAAQSASVPEIERLLDRISSRLPDAEQIVLEFSAMKGNADVFRYALHRHPDLDLSENLRYYAIRGGVPIWETLLEFKPECLDWDIGLHGNPLGLAVQAKDYELVKFLIDRGINVPASHVIGLPVLQYAKKMGLSQECMDLLVQHGSQMNYIL